MTQSSFKVVDMYYISTTLKDDFLICVSLVATHIFFNKVN